MITYSVQEFLQPILNKILQKMCLKTLPSASTTVMKTQTYSFQTAHHQFQFTKTVQTTRTVQLTTIKVEK